MVPVCHDCRMTGHMRGHLQPSQGARAMVSDVTQLTTHAELCRFSARSPSSVLQCWKKGGYPRSVFNKPQTSVKRSRSPQWKKRTYGKPWKHWTQQGRCFEDDFVQSKSDNAFSHCVTTTDWWLKKCVLRHVLAQTRWWQIVQALTFYFIFYFDISNVILCVCVCVLCWGGGGGEGRLSAHARVCSDDSSDGFCGRVNTESTEYLALSNAVF